MQREKPRLSCQQSHTRRTKPPSQLPTMSRGLGNQSVDPECMSEKPANTTHSRHEPAQLSPAQTAEV